jgi:hypothetical protein
VDEGAVEPRAGGEDPLSADRRTLVIAAVAMVVLIAVGVVSAAVFTRSACGAVTPELVATGNGGPAAVDGQIEAVLADALPGLDEQQLAELVDGLAVLGRRRRDGRSCGGGERRRGHGAHRARRGPGGDRTSSHGPARARRPAGRGRGPVAEVDDPAVVVGDGPTLYSLALVNELTGQVDAIVPVTAGSRRASASTPPRWGYR